MTNYSLFQHNIFRKLREGTFDVEGEVYRTPENPYPALRIAETSGKTGIHRKRLLEPEGDRKRR